ncbi:MAG TPA: pyridoxamine 5'-phosphate oxidase family protein [Methanomicrobia archaeon]|nr:putative flavin-nucleotide-binding protein [Candidatus Alkanophaga volatiphilum]HDO64222.1 pyridoxamine 5'-phosphate oxidase family protein [Methanomicrobia archaeon]HEX59815.1 pyridoxamine 5'-phosphate oxidase family protein [Methanomicrobia archaeon]
MAKMPKEVMDMFNDREAAKVLATVSADGVLNVVPVGTLAAVDEETIAFADIFLGKTKSNLEATKKVAATAYKGLDGYQIKGTFQGFQTSGPLFEQMSKAVKEMLKLDVRAVGTIKVEEVYSVGVKAPGKKLA